MKKVLCAALGIVLVVGSMAMPPVQASAAANTQRAEYGVGEGRKIPDHIFAPFVDIVSYVKDSDYSSAGSLSLEKMYKDTGILYYNLGFIMSSGGVNDNKVDWAWGGYSTLSEKSTDKWQLDGIKESINFIRSKGGDVIVSVGGLNEGNFFQVTQDEEILYNTYMDLVQGYGLTRLDLDIEGGGQGKAINVSNARALKRVQNDTGVEIVLTLPVLPSGLTELGLGTMEAYVENGVDVKMVNIMAMCYGAATINPGETYADASVRAIDNTAAQILNTYKNNGKTITQEEAYAKIGVTVSIGEESSSFPIWTTDYSRVVNEKAIESNIGMTSFWCLNRDCNQYGENSGIFGMYEHTNVFKTFMGDNAYTIPEADDDEYVEDGKVIREWKKGTVYVEGDEVIYDGKIWRAAWWTQGDTPGVPTATGDEPWKYVRDVETQTDKPQETTSNNNQPEESSSSGEETTKTQEAVVSDALEINGYQISTTVEGFRVIYSVNDPDGEIESVGLVYGLDVPDADMVVGSGNDMVAVYQATENGKMSKNYGTMENSVSYAMTMKFIKNPEFFKKRIDVRAYAVFKDGSRKYSRISKFTVFDVADILYKNNMMNNYNAHCYLYDNILHFTDSGYAVREYDFRNSLMKP